MKFWGLVFVLSFTPVAGAQGPPAFQADPPKKCEFCAEWSKPHEPFRVFGNTYFVGTPGLGAVLVASDKGHVLLDGGLPQSAPLIDANIRKLGFRTEDVRLIVNSHAHYDHAGGIAALQRASGAMVAASASGAAALEKGGAPADDPLYGLGEETNRFPRATAVRVVTDGETLKVGDLAVKAHLTPGHTPGSTTWTWRSCEGTRCLDVVYADSLNPVSAPGFRFTGDAKHPSLEPSFRKSIATVAALPCDILLTVHPGSADLPGKLQRLQEQPSSEPFIDPAGCRAYADGAVKRLDQRVADERKAPTIR